LADVKPFLCCRPRPDLAPEVAALPYDVFNRQEAAKEIAAHPHSFLRIDKTAALFAPETNEYDARVYARAAEILTADEQAGIYLCEDRPHYFLYRLVKDGRAQTGVVSCIAADDYRTGVLRRHENTRNFKLEDRVQHISALNAQTGPVFVTYRAQERIDAAVAQVSDTTDALYDFIAPDGVRHTVWRVDDSATENALRAGFDALDALYIADGHHRAAAAVEIGARRGGEADTFLIVAFPSNQLEIFDYNRVVFDTNGLLPDELLARVSESFTIEDKGAEPCRPRRRGEFALYLDDHWYRLNIHEDLRSDDPVSGLDVSLLQDNLLAPILGIDDPRSSKRIAYVGGVRGLEELKRRADVAGSRNATAATTGAAATAAVTNAATTAAAASGTVTTAAAADTSTGIAANTGVAFALYPCSLDELFTVADTNRLMPPKSPWFEPKPRSGLFLPKIGGRGLASYR
jgi:uncharacterized protein (DUF1015 family)